MDLNQKLKVDNFMKLFKILLLLLVCTVINSAQGRFQSFLEHVVSLPSNDDRMAAVDSFMIFAQNEGIPFVDNDTANFLYRGNVSSLHLAGDMNGWTPGNNKFSKLIGTDLYFIRKKYELNARLDYKFVINNATWILDPLNPNKISGGYGPNSELAMPEYIQPVEIIYNQGIEHGEIQQHSLHSVVMNRTYVVNVYLPAGYDPVGRTYQSVYFQDGGDYLNLASSINILDNLISENKINPVVAVFITPTNRNDEYAEGNRFKYAEAFVTELVPMVDSIYATSGESQDRLVMGDSFGGNISAIISWHYPEVFANCGLHSGAFWPNNYEIYNTIVDGEKKNIKYYAVWGTYEGLFQNMRSFTNQLLNKGYEIGWSEYPEGHSWGLWRATTDEILEYFYPFTPTNLEAKVTIPESFVVKQNYPNPFNPSTNITYFLPERGKVSIAIYSLLGEKIQELFKGTESAGEHSVNINLNDKSSGVYIYRVIYNDNVSSGKMVLQK